MTCDGFSCNECHFWQPSCNEAHACTLGEAFTFIDKLKEDYPELFL